MASPTEPRVKGVYGPLDDRELAVRVVERGIHHRAIPGTKGQLQRLTRGELEYLRGLGRRVLDELGVSG
jgi:hypothetical protein